MKSVAELHATHPYDRQERYWGYTVPFEDAVGMARELHEQDDPVQYLDDLLKSDHQKAAAINRALLFLPPEVVLDNFGHEVTAWISSNTDVQGDNDGINKLLESEAGYNLEDLETSSQWQWNKHYNSLGKPILANYQFMQHMKDTALANIDREKLLTAHARPDVTLSAKRLDDYALIPLRLEEYNTSQAGGWVQDWSNDRSETIGYNMWLDAPTGYALTYKGLPNAMAGLAMRGVDELMLYQIQGVRGDILDPNVSQFSVERVVGKVKSRGLAPIDWQAFMVATAESLGKNLGVRQLGIQAGKNNHWIKPRRRDEEAHISRETAERAYDATAQRLGFTKSDDDKKGNWHKTIES